MSEALAQLDQAIEQTSKIVDGVTDDLWGNATPCTEFDARGVTNHLIGALDMFTAAITGQAAPAAGGDEKSNFHRAADAVAKAWREPEALTRTLTLPFGEMPGAQALGVNVMEIIVHGLDIAVATGQEAVIDQEMAEAGLAQTKAAGVDNFRVPGVFGAEVAIADDAQPHRRLLAFLGRNV